MTLDFCKFRRTDQVIQLVLVKNMHNDYEVKVEKKKLENG